MDVIKVFVGVPVVVGYVEKSGDPFEAQFVFTADLGYHVVKNSTIINDNVQWQYNAEPGATPGDVYTSLYSSILSHCALMEYPTPGQEDIFAYVPVSLSQIFVNVPALA